MAEKHTSDKDPEKSVDLPPYGSRNPDPITDAPGSHPIETGIGAALGGAASGAAVGAVGGPVGAVIGAAVGGAIAGGLAGKGIGELIDPTTEDNWLREYYESDTTRPADATEEMYRPAYHYGVDASTRYSGRRWDEVEPDLRTGWERSRGDSNLSWDEARGASRHAYDRSSRFYAERQTGSVNVPVEHQQMVVDQCAIDPERKDNRTK